MSRAPYAPEAEPRRPSHSGVPLAKKCSRTWPADHAGPAARSSAPSRVLRRRPMLPSVIAGRRRRLMYVAGNRRLRRAAFPRFVSLSHHAIPRVWCGRHGICTDQRGFATGSPNGLPGIRRVPRLHLLDCPVPLPRQQPVRYLLRIDRGGADLPRVVLRALIHELTYAVPRRGSCPTPSFSPVPGPPSRSSPSPCGSRPTRSPPPAGPSSRTREASPPICRAPARPPPDAPNHGRQRSLRRRDRPRVASPRCGPRSPPRPRPASVSESQ